VDERPRGEILSVAQLAAIFHEDPAVVDSWFEQYGIPHVVTPDGARFTTWLLFSWVLAEVYDLAGALRQAEEAFKASGLGEAELDELLSRPETADDC
jgi:hypothetical protein